MALEAYSYRRGSAPSTKWLSPVQPLSLISTLSIRLHLIVMLSTVFTFTALLVATASASPILVSRQISSAGWAYKGCFTEATGRKFTIS